MTIDVNVNVSRWPFRRLSADEAPKLCEKLSAWGVKQAWAASFDGVFHKDVDGVNARLAEQCSKPGACLLRPFGTVNPASPDWREDLRRCHEKYHMPGIRLHPNYHGYGLDHPAFAQLLALAEQRGLIVQLALRMEDLRTQHSLMQVPDVDVKPLLDLVANRPQLRIVLLNSLKILRSNTVAALAAAGNVYFEISMLEGVGGVGDFLTHAPVDRVLFGSHFPLFILESAVFKLRESALHPAQIEAINYGNAERLLQLSG